MLFNFLYGSHKNTSHEETEEPEERVDGQQTGEEEEDQDSGFLIPDINRDMPIDLMAGEDTVLLTGKLSFFDADRLVLKRLPRMMSLPVLDKGSSVRIRGYTRSMMPFNLNASVIQSCLTSCTLGDLKLIPYQNSRSYLRQPVDVPGDLYRLNDSYLNSPQECQVLDIGVGGARVVSARSYPVGTQLRLGLELLEGSGYMTFPGQVVRVREKSDGRYEYGFLFAQLVKRKADSLERTIAEVQKKMKKTLAE